MPIRKQDYHPDWPAISRQVREEANQRCEWCGAPNGKVIQRIARSDASIIFKQEKYPGWDFFVKHTIEETDGSLVEASSLTWARLRFHKLSKIVLTVAHLDRNSHNNDRNNLAALCQRCHLRHDIRQHVANRTYGRHHTREHQFKLDI